MQTSSNASGRAGTSRPSRASSSSSPPASPRRRSRSRRRSTTSAPTEAPAQVLDEHRRARRRGGPGPPEDGTRPPRRSRTCGRPTPSCGPDRRGTGRRRRAGRGLAPTTLRRARALDRRPAALGARGARDLRAPDRALRRPPAHAARRSSPTTPKSCAPPPGSRGPRSASCARWPSTCSGELELDRLDELPTTRSIAELVAVKGIGEWTAHMFLMFHLDRPDVLAVGDLGIRRAVDAPTGSTAAGAPRRWSGRRALAAAPHAGLPLSLAVAGQRAGDRGPGRAAGPARRLASHPGQVLHGAHKTRSCSPGRRCSVSSAMRPSRKRTRSSADIDTTCPERSVRSMRRSTKATSGSTVW